MISTHLDGDCLAITPVFQRNQARELLAGPAATTLPLVLVGDLNSAASATGLAYNDLIAAGFADAWAMSGSGPDLTCCQAGTLLNVASTLNRRIDYVLIRGEITPLGTRVIGNEPSDKTPSGMWPSDHAGVVAVLAVPRSNGLGGHQEH